MARVRFLSPFNRLAGADCLDIEQATLGDLCRELARRFGGGLAGLVDDQGRLSGRVVILVDRRNAHSLRGADTPLQAGTEVLIMPPLVGG